MGKLNDYDLGNIKLFVRDNIRHSSECSHRAGSETCSCDFFNQRAKFEALVDLLTTGTYAPTHDDKMFVTAFLNEFATHDDSCRSWWKQTIGCSKDERLMYGLDTERFNCNCGFDMLRIGVVKILQKVGIRNLS